MTDQLSWNPRRKYMFMAFVLKQILQFVKSEKTRTEIDEIVFLLDRTQFLHITVAEVVKIDLGMRRIAKDADVTDTLKMMSSHEPRLEKERCDFLKTIGVIN